MNTKAKKRIINIDLIKSIAVLSVLSVHFFLHNGFYNTLVNNGIMYFMTALRTLFMICVPLFMITTGYLMINKELNAAYYKGIIKTVSIYVMASVCCLVFKHYNTGEIITFKSAVSGILAFTAAPYSWYIEMYIGLFLIIPFLNLIMNNLKTQNQRIALIITFMCMTTLPSFLNYYQKYCPISIRKCIL